MNAPNALAVLLGSIVLLPVALQAQTDSRAAMEITALVASYDSSWNSQDTVGVGRLLAPGYQYFTSRGDLTSRAATMSFLASPDYVLARAKRSELAVTRSGPVAVVSSRWQGEGTFRGERFTDDQRCGQVWLKTGRSWHLVSEHCVQIAAKPAAPSN
jgi:ketosteroid isomerase-like protein